MRPKLRTEAESVEFLRSLGFVVLEGGDGYRLAGPPPQSVSGEITRDRIIDYATGAAYVYGPSTVRHLDGSKIPGAH